MENKTEPKKSTKKLGIIIGIAFIVVTLAWYLLSIGAFGTKERPAKTTKSRTSYINRDFKNANAGEIWKILDDNIAVMKEPKTTMNKAEFINNLVTLLGYGEKVVVIKTKSIYWKYCKVKGKYYGWILGDTVKSARKIN